MEGTEQIEQESASPLVIDHGDTRTVDEGQQPVPDGPSELEQHKRARGYVKDETPAKVEEQPAVEQPKAEEKKPERWKDPETGDTYDMRHKVARRIKQVLEKHGAERARAEKAEAERDRLLALVERGVAAKPEPVAPKVETDAEPDANDLTKYPEGQYDKGFIRDMARWSARQETQTQFETANKSAQERQAQEAEDARIAHWNDSALPEARKRYADFDEVLARIPNTPETAPIVRMMMGSPVGNDVVYVLGTNPEAMAMYQRAPNYESRLRLLHHIEAQAIQALRKPAEKPAPATTKAPAPIDPVAPGTATHGIDWSKDDPDQLQRWKAQRRSTR